MFYGRQEEGEDKATAAGKRESCGAECNVSELVQSKAGQNVLNDGRAGE